MTLLLDKAHRAVKQQNWEELLTCLTDDGRDEWIFEITTGSSLAMTMLEKQGGVAVLTPVKRKNGRNSKSHRDFFHAPKGLTA